jgi:hypothetical protein
MIHCKLICLSTIYLYPRILTSKDIGIRPFPDFIRYLACQRLNCSNSTEIPKNGKFLFRRLARKSNVATRIIQRGRRFYVAACKRIFNADKRVFVKPCAVWVLPAWPPEKMWKSARDGLYQSAFRVGDFPGRRFQFPARRLCVSGFRQCQNKASLGAEGIKVVRRRTAATFRITIKAPLSGSEEQWRSCPASTNWPRFSKQRTFKPGVIKKIAVYGDTQWQSVVSTVEPCAIPAQERKATTGLRRSGLIQQCFTEWGAVNRVSAPNQSDWRAAAATGVSHRTG